GRVDQAPRHRTGRADEVHAAGIAIPAVLDDGDVDIDDVALPQNLPRCGDAVTDDVVDRCADGFGKTLVADVGGNRLLHVDDVVVADAIQRFGADSGLDVFADHVQHFGGQCARNAGLVDLRGRSNQS